MSHIKTKTIIRNQVVTCPDGTLDRVPVRFLVRFMIVAGAVVVFDERPIHEWEATAPAPRRVQHAKDQTGHLATARKRRRKARKGAPDNVVGMVKLAESDLAGVR